MSTLKKFYFIEELHACYVGSMLLYYLLLSPGSDFFKMHLFNCSKAKAKFKAEKLTGCYWPNK